MEKYNKLNNAPIVEVIIGFEINNLFDSNEIIKAFSTDRFTKSHQLKSGYIEFLYEPKIIENNLDAIELFTEDRKECIHIECNKIFYSELFSYEHKYDEFNTYYNKFERIIHDISEHFKKDIEILNIDLRYINKFSLPIKELDLKFKILPLIDCKINNEQNYAKIRNYFSLSNIVSDFNPNIEAIIKTNFKSIEENKIEVLFDIDTSYKGNAYLSNSDDIKERINNLKTFKNHIFFNNFVDIDNMEQFK